MPFPVSPINGQTATVNGVSYTYNSTYTLWTRNASPLLGTTSSWTISNTTNATSTTTGALTVTGGAGFGGNLYQAGVHVIQNTTSATSTTTGALQVAGGVGIQGNLVSGGSVFSVNTFGFKNRVINGDMRFDQRNGGTAVSIGSGGYSVDRWYFYNTGASLSVQRVAGFSGFPYALQVTGAASNTQMNFFQWIESVNCGDLVSQTVTVSFYASCSVSTNCYIQFGYGATVDSNASVTVGPYQTFTVTSTTQQFSFQMAVSSTATNGLRLGIGTLGAFTSGVFKIAGVQLESGSVATPFDYRDYASELVRCQRYYQKSYDIETAAGTATRTGYVNWNWGNMMSYATVSIVLPVRMRASPTVTNYNPDLTNTVGGRYWNGSAEVAFTGSLSGISGYSSGFIFAMDGTSRSNMLFQWTASAEII
jgi:hypothetical protein